MLICIYRSRDRRPGSCPVQDLRGPHVEPRTSESRRCGSLAAVAHPASPAPRPPSPRAGRVRTCSSPALCAVRLSRRRQAQLAPSAARGAAGETNALALEAWLSAEAPNKVGRLHPGSSDCSEGADDSLDPASQAPLSLPGDPRPVPHHTTPHPGEHTWGTLPVLTPPLTWPP